VRVANNVCLPREARDQGREFHDEGVSIGKARRTGAIAGAIAAIIIGFAWGGWVTGGKAGRMAETSAETAVVQALTPLCVAKTEQEPEQLVRPEGRELLSARRFCRQSRLDSVNEKYRSAVAEACRRGHGSKADCGAC